MKPRVSRQSDIVIEPGGRVHISFLWSDLQDLLPALQGLQGKSAESSEEQIPEILSSLPALPTIREEFYPEYISCRLCPKKCGFNRVAGSHPTCGNHELRVATFGLSFGDEPQIRGERGSGAIMLSGCPLTCVSCHNPEKVASGTVVSFQGLLEICQNLLGQGAHNVQILSPTVHLPRLRSLLSTLKKNSFPLPLLLKSSGYEDPVQLRKLNGLVDIYVPDFKFGDCSSWARRAGVRDYFKVTGAAIEEMYRQVGPVVLNKEGVMERGVMVRHVESPLPREEKERINHFLSHLPRDILVSRQDNFVSLENWPGRSS